MSNEVTTILQNIQKNQTALVQTGVDDDTRAVAGSGAGKRISIKGGVFRKMVAGEEIAALEERHMNVIFVKMAHDPSRQYYEKAYKEGVKASPKCWSSNAKVPDESVKEPLAKTCDKCPKAVKGTGQNGQGTACRLSWRTAVVLPNDPSGDVMQLVLPAASVFGKSEEAGRWPFRKYVQMLAHNNISAGMVVTKMSFDTKAPAPRVLFSPVSSVDMNDIDVLKAQAQSLAAEQAIQLTVYQQDASSEEDDDDDAEPEPPQAEKPDAEKVPEPKLRAVKDVPSEEDAPKDVSDIVKKWSAKKE